MRRSNEPSPAEDAAHEEAQRAADSLKEQIAAVRARIREAKKTLREHAKREREPRTFKP